VTARHSTQTLPQPQGGALSDGTYLLTDVVYYGMADDGPDSSQFKGLLVVSAGGTALQAINQGLPEAERRYGAAMSASGTNIMSTLTCRDGQTMTGVPPAPRPYTATANEIRLWDENGKVKVYTKQP
jgi:hypothetical protein